MKIKCVVEIDEYTLSGLNNSIAAIGDVYYSLFIGCNVDAKFDKLKVLSDEELRLRMEALKILYFEIERQYNAEK